MSPRSVTEQIVREAPTLRSDEPIGEALGKVLDSRLPALPVVDARGRLVGIFGEREFFGAVFPGYLKELKYAAFVPRSLDDALHRRAGCRFEPVGDHMNTEHVDVGPDASDAQVVETFLHHRVLILPVVDDGEVTGVITRHDFFRALAESFVG